VENRTETAVKPLNFVKVALESHTMELGMLNGIEYPLRSREQTVLLEIVEPAATLMSERLKELQIFKNEIILAPQLETT
jgi:hypothetical protein